MRIALDAMGGDHAPGPIVAGAVQAVQADPDLHVVLVGDQAQVEPLLAGADRARLELFHCTQVVGMEESPVFALRKKPDNSISRCWQLLAEKKVDAVVSAGNTAEMLPAQPKSIRALSCAIWAPTFSTLGCCRYISSSITSAAKCNRIRR